MRRNIWILLMVLAVALVACGKSSDKDRDYDRYRYTYENDPHYNQYDRTNWDQNWNYTGQSFNNPNYQNGGFIWCPNGYSGMGSIDMFNSCLSYNGAPGIYYNGGLYNPNYFRGRVVDDYYRNGYGYRNFNDFFCNGYQGYGNASFYAGYGNTFGNFCGSGNLFGGNYGYYSGGTYISW